MTRDQMKMLLDYEIQHLIYKDSIRKSIQETFGLICQEDSDSFLPSENFELLDLVLDALEVPPDDEYARDEYNNIYMRYIEELEECGQNCPLNVDLESLLTELENERDSEKEYVQEDRVIFEKEYSGYESISDLERDMIECFDPKYNKEARHIPGEFEGNVRVKVTYEE